MSENYEAIKCAENAYIALLSIPMDTLLRHDAQAALIAVRELLAKYKGQTSEQVQTGFEDYVATQAELTRMRNAQ